MSKTWIALTLLHLERPKLDGVLAVLSAVGLIQKNTTVRHGKILTRLIHVELVDKAIVWSLMGHSDVKVYKNNRS